jgi:hypothetical protein
MGGLRVLLFVGIGSWLALANYESGEAYENGHYIEQPQHEGYAHVDYYSPYKDNGPRHDVYATYWMIVILVLSGLGILARCGLFRSCGCSKVTFLGIAINFVLKLMCTYF